MIMGLARPKWQESVTNYMLCVSAMSVTVFHETKLMYIVLAGSSCGRSFFRLCLAHISGEMLTSKVSSDRVIHVRPCPYYPHARPESDKVNI